MADMQQKLKSLEAKLQANEAHVKVMNDYPIFFSSVSHS